MTMKRIDDSARERNSKDAAQRRKTFGRRRGQWLEQVHDDPEMTGDFCRVMFAITRYVDPSLSCYPGDPELAKRAHVSIRTVERARQLARERGHIQETFRGCKGTVITLLLHTEPRQIVEVQESKPRQEPRQLERGSPLESKGRAPNSCNSCNSQEREDSAPSGAGTEDSNRVPNVDDGHPEESTGRTTESTPATVATKISESDDNGHKSESSAGDAIESAAVTETIESKSESTEGAARDLAAALLPPWQVEQLNRYKAKIAAMKAEGRESWQKKWGRSYDNEVYVLEGAIGEVERRVRDCEEVRKQVAYLGPNRYRAFAKYDDNDQGYDAGEYDNPEDAIAAVWQMSILLRAASDSCRPAFFYLRRGAVGGSRRPAGGVRDCAVNRRATQLRLRTH